jgi:hypothetical protein
LNQVKTYGTLVVTSVDFRSGDYPVAVSYNFKVLLREAEILNEVVILLKNIKNRQPGDSKKIWERKRKTVCICLINTRWKSMKRLSST